MDVMGGSIIDFPSLGVEFFRKEKEKSTQKVSSTTMISSIVSLRMGLILWSLYTTGTFLKVWRKNIKDGWTRV
jgi:hypothetical protein